MKLLKPVEDVWYLNVPPEKANPLTGKGYVHEHGRFGMHPVTRRHQERKLKAKVEGRFVCYYFGRKFIFGASFKTDEIAQKRAEGFNKLNEKGREGIVDLVGYYLFEE